MKISKEFELLFNQSKKESIWDLGNDWLYDLFQSNSRNTNPQEIVAKVWILGRAYAAAVERRKNSDNMSNEEFYKTKIVEAIKKAKLDEKLDKLKKNPRNDNSKLILETHYSLVKAIKEITGQKKRSFCSKYLHFHLPNCFFIYDSRAVAALRLLTKGQRFSINSEFEKSQNEEEKIDYIYTKFYFQSKAILKLLQEHFNTKITKRDFDTFLLTIHNQKSS